VSLEDCLVAGGDRPLLDLNILSDVAVTHLRLRRSTLVGREAALQVRANRTETSTPALDCTCWDTILARSGDQPGGDMVVLGEGAAPSTLRWRAVNCYYAGWQALLRSRAQTTADIAAWRGLFHYSDGDLASAQNWPLLVHHELAQVSAAEYGTAGTHAAFAATSGPGALGCEVGLLPPGRGHWLRLTYDWNMPPVLDLPPAASPVEVPAAGDGRYHGGDVDCDRVDLGSFVRLMEHEHGLGRRVVLHVHGSGRRPTSAVRVRGSTLVLDFGSGQDPPEESLTLVPRRNSPTARAAALVEVENGDLVIVGGRFRVPAEARTTPAHLLRVRGGHLVLSGCRLDGPLAREPSGYEGLIEFHGSGNGEPDKARGCALTDCVLTSTRQCLRAVGTGAQVLLTNCVVVAGTDGLVFEPGTAANGRLNVQCLLDHCTFALKRAAVYVARARADRSDDPLLIQATANVFTDPFRETPRGAGLLLFEGDALGRGLLAWQGRGNAYDVQRLSFYALPETGPAAGRKQPYAAWKRLWGSPGDVQPVLQLAWPRTFGKDAPRLAMLAVPARRSTEFRTPPGADLARLGLLKKSQNARQ
jgi:hypothetical protein